MSTVAIGRPKMIDKRTAAFSFILVAMIYKTSRVLYESDDHLYTCLYNGTKFCVSRINSLPWRAESRIRAYLTLPPLDLSVSRSINYASRRYIRHLKIHSRVANYFHNMLVHYFPSHASSRDVCLMHRTANTFIMFIKELINSHFKQIRRLHSIIKRKPFLLGESMKLVLHMIHLFGIQKESMQSHIFFKLLKL